MNLKQALIDNDSIQLGLIAKDWKEAVQLSVQPLIDSGAVKPEYYDAIIESRAIWSILYFNARNGYASCTSGSRCIKRFILINHP